MKTLLKTLIIGILLFTVSCNSNDDDATNNTGGTTASIIGAWDLVNTDGTISVTLGGVPISGTISGSNYNNSSLTFTENPNKLDLNFDYTMTATASLLGVPQTYDLDINESQSGLDWTKTNNTISVTGGTNDLDFEIVELTNTNLTLKVAINETVTFQGQTTQATGFANHYYTK